MPKKNKKKSKRKSKSNSRMVEDSSHESFSKKSVKSKTEETHYLTHELCKYFMQNNCQRGDNCSYSHQTKLFPCKWIHATGMCDKGEGCRFSHQILNPREIQKFMAENEEFLEERFLKEGNTNLGSFYTKFREE